MGPGAGNLRATSYPPYRQTCSKDWCHCRDCTYPLTACFACLCVILTHRTRDVARNPGIRAVHNARRLWFAVPPGDTFFQHDPCPAGSYYGPCPSCKTCAELRLCPAGHACPGNTSGPVACALGEFCPLGSATPQPCPAGFFCYTPATSVTCPAHHWCGANATRPAACSRCSWGMMLACTPTSDSVCWNMSLVGLATVVALVLGTSFVCWRRNQYD